MWTCTNCRSQWTNGKLRCTCGRKRPARLEKPKHTDILNEMPYEEWVKAFGKTCNICGASPKPGGKLNRDHWHWGPLAGKPRGLLCWLCNKDLTTRMEKSGWLLRAQAYVDERSG